MNAQTFFSSTSSCALLAAALLTSPAAAQSTTRVSLTSQGHQVNGNSTASAISADGWTVAFQSLSSELVPGDTNGASDIFVHDRSTGRTTRVSVSSAGMQAASFSLDPSISADGMLVAFHSQAANLVPGDTNGCSDVFIHDRSTGQTVRVSVDAAGVQGDDFSRSASISADGRFVAFVSRASNLVPGHTNGVQAVLVHDRLTGQTTLASVSSRGASAGTTSEEVVISGDGRFVAFKSEAANLVPGDTNNRSDIFVHDRQSSQTRRVSVETNGNQSLWDSYHPAISADGRFVAFVCMDSLAFLDTNGLADVYVHDLQTAQTVLASVSSSGALANSYSEAPAISADGRIVAFHSSSDNLAPGDTNTQPDVFLHNLTTGQTLLASVTSAGAHGNRQSQNASLSADGSTIAFDSDARNLVPADTNLATDVFVRDLDARDPVLAKTGSCPGPISLTITSATPHGQVALACGPAGTFVRSSAPCAGLQLGVTPPAQITILRADAAGAAALNFRAPAALCGRSVQAVDSATCLASNVIVL